ncbi:FKBP-type peptidyl-prolyl cis-trans isomerase [Aliikangiella marina]|nr:FKBP-type peptidyl-prolyl cis-trans isomerase [Aliikangiella marina]
MSNLKTLRAFFLITSIIVLQACEQPVPNNQLQKLKAEGQAYLAKNKSVSGVTVTESGLQYQVLVNGDGIKPSASDTVEVHYVGTLINGEEFDSSYKRGNTISFPLNRVIKGWTEGLQLMPVGSKYKFTIPYNLAYGERGKGSTIPPYATLIFEVELVAIK